MQLRAYLLTLIPILLGIMSGDVITAEEKPLWELGVGISGLVFPHYRGSDQFGSYAIPFPYIIYRGEFLKADRHGVRGSFFDSDWIEFNISVGASLPVNSDSNDARKNMPDLDPTFEIGPSINFKLWHTPDRHYALDLRLPLRTAVTVGDNIHDIGWEFSPRINLNITNIMGLPGWNMGALIGPLYSTKRNNSYFYSVAPEYATPDRPAYDASGGYAGSQFTLTLSKRYQNYWLGAFVRWDSLSGAVFADSPLVKTTDYFAAGLGVAWIFGKSTTMVKTKE